MNYSMNQYKQAIKKGKTSSSSHFKSAVKELLKSYKKAFICSLRTENCDKIAEKYCIIRNQSWLYSSSPDTKVIMCKNIWYTVTM
jgi:hypothetical protein